MTVERVETVFELIPVHLYFLLYLSHYYLKNLVVGLAGANEKRMRTMRMLGTFGMNVHPLIVWKDKDKMKTSL
jgi:hypothetical protein